MSPTRTTVVVDRVTYAVEVDNAHVSFWVDQYTLGFASHVSVYERVGGRLVMAWAETVDYAGRCWPNGLKHAQRVKNAVQRKLSRMRGVAR